MAGALKSAVASGSLVSQKGKGYFVATVQSRLSQSEIEKQLTAAAKQSLLFNVLFALVLSLITFAMFKADKRSLLLTKLMFVLLFGLPMLIAMRILFKPVSHQVLTRLHSAMS